VGRCDWRRRSGSTPTELSGPRSPAAEDDEFDSTTLDSKWTEVTAGTAPTITIDEGRRSNYLAEFPSADGSVTLSEDFIPGSADFSVTAKFHYQADHSFQGARLLVMDSSFNNGVSMAIMYAGGAQGVSEIRSNEWPSFSSIGTNVSPPTYTTTIFFHIERHSGSYNFWWSLDGFGWHQQPGGGSSLSFTVGKIRLFFFQAPSGTTSKSSKSCDWVRRDWIFLND
jgi:hypothetical protein